jgi:hypothetical protein
MGALDNLRVLRDVAVGSGAQDPLISALVDKLPSAGTSWSGADRQAWLTMMANAFDVVYGAGAGGSMRQASPAAALPKRAQPSRPKAAKKARRPAAPKPLGPTGPAFFIDKQGFARKRGGDRIMPHEVMDFLVDLRGEHGDLAAITWSDDSTGIPRGKQLDITIG